MRTFGASPDPTIVVNGPTVALMKGRLASLGVEEAEPLDVRVRKTRCFGPDESLRAAQPPSHSAGRQAEQRAANGAPHHARQARIPPHRKPSNEPLVASEQLISPIAGERHCHMTTREL